MKQNPVSELNADKLTDQQSFLELWKNHSARGSLVATTGYGKTTVGILAIQEMNHNHPDRITHVIVPTLALRKQWEELLKLWNLTNTTVYVINSYVKKARFTHLLILDELHRYGCKTFSKVFTNTTYHFIMGLTATLERQDGNHNLIQKYAPVLRTINLQEARQHNYVSDFVIFNFGIELSDDERAEYENINQCFDYYFSKFDNNFNKAINALKSTGYRNSLSLSYGKTQREILSDAVNFTQIMHQRKSFLNELPSKLDTLISIYRHLNRKMIVFSETTHFADMVAEKIGAECFAFHTAITNKKAMRENLVMFKQSNHFKVLSAVKSLEEGLDIPELEAAILVSGNSTKRQYLQRIGRSLRVKPGKKAIIINIYVNETKDQNWLMARQFTNEQNLFWVSSINQIMEIINTGDDGTFVTDKSDRDNYSTINCSAANFNSF
jgi:superfamily II DNA or RNA helicase